jgi:hypothetical protein
MAMRRETGVQGDLVATWAEMPRSPGHAFYDKLQKLLTEAGDAGLRYRRSGRHGRHRQRHHDGSAGSVRHAGGCRRAPRRYCLQRHPGDQQQSRRCAGQGERQSSPRSAASASWRADAMRIRLRTTLAGPALTAGAGDIVTVAPALGAALIEAGSPDGDVPQPAVAPPPETATAGPQRRRPR